MRIGLIVAAVAGVLALPAATSARGPVDFVLRPGDGAGGARLGMTRARVIETLGRPYYENRNGYMQYEPDNGTGLFDVYRFSGSHRSRVRMVGVSDRRFRLPDGSKIFFKRGVLPHIQHLYGHLHFRRSESGLDYLLYTRLRGHLVTTDFEVDRHSLRHALVATIFIVVGRG